MEEKKKAKKRNRRRKLLIGDEDYVSKVMRTESRDLAESMAIINTRGAIRGRKL